MFTHAINRYLAVLQLVLLSLIFALPMLSQGEVQPVSFRALNIVAEFEFAILVIGWLIAGLLFFPLALTGGTVARLVSLAVALLISWPLTNAYHHEYGWVGAVSIYWLLFANYGAVFLHSRTLYGHRRLLAELGLRAISYPILFVFAAGIFDMPSTVGRWPDSGRTYGFGTVYFGVLAFLEYRRAYPRTVNFFAGVMSGRYQPLPRQEARIRNGRLKPHLVKRDTIHLWWVFLLLGLVVGAMVSVFVYASITGEMSRALQIALWLFCLPFGLAALILVLGSLWLAVLYFTTRPAWLAFEREAAVSAARLVFEGFVPRLDRRLERGPLSPVLKCYLLTFPPHEDEFATVETVVDLPLNSGLAESASRDGTRFQIECDMPAPPAESDGENTRLVWQLQVDVTEFVPDHRLHPGKALSLDARSQRQWSVAFVLPL